MPVPNTMADLATLAGSNSPQGTETVFPDLDNYIRAVEAILRSTYAVSSSTLASASTTDLATSSGEHVNVTGTATITSLGTAYAGCIREVRFSGACTLTHSANLLLPGAANVVTAANDVYTFRCLAAGQWIMVSQGVTVGGVQTISGAKTFSANTTFGSGINFGSTAAASTTDLSKHIALFGSNTGFSVTTGFLNLNSGGQVYQFDGSGNFSSPGAIRDGSGDVRSVPQTIQDTSYVFVAADAGRAKVKTTASAINYTVNGAVHAAGDVITVINNSTAGNLTLVAGGGMTMRLAGTTTTGSRTVAPLGHACIVFVSGAGCYVSGPGVT